MHSISVVIPTLNRGESLAATLESLLTQTLPPQEVVVVDGSDAPIRERTLALLAPLLQKHPDRLRVVAAAQTGAAPQRNQGVALSTGALVLFLDDDMRLEPDCLERLQTAMETDPRIGGVCGIIVNHCYHPPGRFSRLLFAWLNGTIAPSYAGRCFGSAFTTLPADGADVPEIAPLEWMLTGCALYRRDALPVPAFLPRFTGASIAEDLALSLQVARNWRLVCARRARLRHLEPPKIHTPSQAASLSEMEMLNRHFIMTRILGNHSLADHVKFLVMNLVTLNRSGGLKLFLAQLLGRFQALVRLLCSPPSTDF
jgi:GT2 family glycosyltransferase